MILLSAALVCGSGLLSSQELSTTPAPGAGTQTYTDEMGFSYSLPADWTMVDTRPVQTEAKRQAEKDAGSEGEKSAEACVETPLRATHGNPGSSIGIVVVSFDCYGQQFESSGLAGFGKGFAEGMKKGWNLADPVYGTYTLGSHSLWIEHADGSLVTHPEVKRTMEMVCSFLKKAAVCWVSFTEDEADLRAFEHGQVTLDGEAPKALVPANAFATKTK